MSAGVPSPESARELAPDLAAVGDQIDRLLASSDEGVYGVDREGRATLVTPSVAEMTGHRVEELIGSSMHELLHHSHPNGHGYAKEDCPIYAAFRDGQVHQAEETFWRKDGSPFRVTYTSTPLVRAGALVGAVVVFRDLGRRYQARERLACLVQALQPALAKDGSLVTATQPAREASQTRVHPDEEESSAPVGASVAWLAAMDAARRLAQVDTTVLLLGESGTGKELVARAIHEGGPRRTQPLVKVNCAAIAPSLIESELFGHERGAFTGATARRIGRFEQAEAGTLLLDEVGELPLEAQAKLLRVLQERELERVGGTQTIACRARVVAATNADLPALIAAGRFRADLFYRLNVFPLHLPPLRDRRDDIPLLVRHFVRRMMRRLGRTLHGFSPDAELRLLEHDWPGNVRELESVVERAALLSDGPVFERAPIGDLRAPPRSSLAAVPFVSAEVSAGDAAHAGANGADERAIITRALERSAWKVTGPHGAAAALAVHPNTLRNRMRRLGIRRPSP